MLFGNIPYFGSYHSLLLHTCCVSSIKNALRSSHLGFLSPLNLMLLSPLTKILLFPIPLMAFLHPSFGLSRVPKNKWAMPAVRSCGVGNGEHKVRGKWGRQCFEKTEPWSLGRTTVQNVYDSDLPWDPTLWLWKRTSWSGPKEAESWPKVYPKHHTDHRPHLT